MMSRTARRVLAATVAPLLLVLAAAARSAPALAAAPPADPSAALVAAVPDTSHPAAAPVTDPALSGALPPGAIIAFMPRAGQGYRDLAELRHWLMARGWALCDGTSGTPDLRERLLLGTTDPDAVGQRVGTREHAHRIAGETEDPVRRNRNTPTGRQQLLQIPDDQHRHRLDLTSAKAEHLPPSLKVLFIMKLR